MLEDLEKDMKEDIEATNVKLKRTIITPIAR